MGIESYGGSCPHCQKALMQKHESGSGWFQFDACVWCGFAFGEVGFQEEMSPVQVWMAIFEQYGVTSRDELIQQLKLEEYVSEADSEIWPSVFMYPELRGDNTQHTPYDPMRDFASRPDTELMKDVFRLFANGTNTEDK